MTALDAIDQHRFVVREAERLSMAMGARTNDDHSRAARFLDLALPHFDDVYTLARYLLRNATDADDAVQECYLRAFQHFDSFQGPAIKPWLMAILRNVCHTEYARRKFLSTDDAGADAHDEAVPLWQEPP